MNNIETLKGTKPGPTIVIMAGVHGNEQVGIKAFDRIRETLSIKAGILHLIVANPDAIRENKRFVKTNMNRAFGESNRATTSEEIRALEIRRILDTSDALLDIHAFNDLEGGPFAIADGAGSIACAKILNVPILSTGWDSIHTGSSDWYMHQRGKIGVCIECGPISKQDLYVDLAIDSIHRFLSHFNLLDFEFIPPTKQRLVHITRSIQKKSINPQFTKEYSNFERLESGKVFLVDGQDSYTALDNEVIVFPRPNTLVGGELAIVGKEISA